MRINFFLLYATIIFIVFNIMHIGRSNVFQPLLVFGLTCHCMHEMFAFVHVVKLCMLVNELVPSCQLDA